MDLVPTFTTSNQRICLLLANGKMGFLRIEDAERLQVNHVLRARAGFVVLDALATAPSLPAMLLQPECLGVLECLWDAARVLCSICTLC